jgi:hypothetical protein
VFRTHLLLLSVSLALQFSTSNQANVDESDGTLHQPIASSHVVFAGENGTVTVEAEHFFRQEKAKVRTWYRATSKVQPEIDPDGDPPHVGGASGGAYLESLPDTRRTHGDKLISGQNFSTSQGNSPS